MQPARLAYIVGNEAPGREKEFRSPVRATYQWPMTGLRKHDAYSPIYLRILIKGFSFFYYCLEYIVMMRSRICAGDMPFF
jgi:hypothetical protein